METALFVCSKCLYLSLLEIFSGGWTSVQLNNNLLHIFMKTRRRFWDGQTVFHRRFLGKHELFVIDTGELCSVCIHKAHDLSRWKNVLFNVRLSLTEQVSPSCPFCYKCYWMLFPTFLWVICLHRFTCLLEKYVEGWIFLHYTKEFLNLLGEKVLISFL